MRLLFHLHRKENVSYPAVIEAGLLQKVPQILHTAQWGRSVAIITDSKVKKLYADQLLAACKREGMNAEVFTIPVGEEQKTLGRVEQLAERLIAADFKRDTLIVALGGGVITDLAGFLASIFMRGVPYINIPTTLLAMVDASLGGKTGVDLKSGKNLLGTFHQPRAVYIDPEVLATLSERQYRNGLAEVIKHAIIGDRRLFRFLRKRAEQILARDPKMLDTLIVRSIKVKQRLVERDERESQLRMLLNYGHTIGHAIEQCTDYKISHGEAISIGMVLENEFFIRRRLLGARRARKILQLLELYKLPIHLPEDVTKGRLHRAIAVDKKMLAGKLHMALPKRIGKARIVAIANTKSLLEH